MMQSSHLGVHISVAPGCAVLAQVPHHRERPSAIKPKCGLLIRQSSHFLLQLMSAEMERKTIKFGCQENALYTSKHAIQANCQLPTRSIWLGAFGARSAPAPPVFFFQSKERSSLATGFAHSMDDVNGSGVVFLCTATTPAWVLPRLHSRCNRPSGNTYSHLHTSRCGTVHTPCFCIGRWKPIGWLPLATDLTSAFGAPVHSDFGRPCLRA
jgi:hypothetical protein